MTIEDLLTKWLGKRGAGERAEYQQFLSEFMAALGVPSPGDPGFAVADYRFEAPVKSEVVFGNTGTKRADLYKRDCFILEAKQTQLKPGEIAPAEPDLPPPEPVRDLFGTIVGHAAPAGKPPPRYDRLMADARIQAERYAIALPDDHRSPPFLIVADIGRSFELYFDWAGNGRGYAPFPNERAYRIALADLADPALLPDVRLSAADVLRGIWTDPAGIDPRLKAAEVTRDIAERLSRVAERLEKDERDRHPGHTEIALGIEATSLFLMRTLFCMFAEDVELLPKDSFKTFLADAKDRSDQFWRSGLSDLWSRMNSPEEVNRYWSQGDAIVRYFNGNLFANTRIYDLPSEFKGELLVAAGKDWRAVEPAIFGTLLEQVLTEADRAKLGAHYTPRAYVERLVEATMMEVLRPEWEAVRAQAMGLLEGSPLPAREGQGVGAERSEASTPAANDGESFGRADARTHPQPLPASREGSERGALILVTAFHASLADLRILDPACGTGNFLYVAMEQLLRLEGEVRTFAAGLGVTLAPAVHPNQFLGLELNPRAAVIAELVLWIGWLRYRLANSPEAIGEPVLPPLTNINGGTHGGYDAVLVRTDTGQPDVDNPRRPVWPDADFIVGNPPFIGGKNMRGVLDADHPGYAEALWRANRHVPPSADFVMQWWDRAADILTSEGTRLRRFGFVTTNSITQTFSRRVIERHLHPSPSGEGPGVGAVSLTETDELEESPHPNPSPEGEGLNARKLHLTLAIPDHPWTRAGKDAAAVRIAMTVAQAGPGTGTLVTIAGERPGEDDAMIFDESVATGTIHADLSIGTDVTRVVPLKANDGLSSRGVQLMGAGFIVTPAEAKALGLGERPGLEAHIRAYRNGRDLLQRPRGVMVIDLFGLSENAVMEQFPEVYQHLLTTVRIDREKQVAKSPTADAKAYLKTWWVFGKPRTELRPALAGLTRYIGTVESAARRIFEFIDCSIVPDNKIIVFPIESAFDFGVLNSRFHIQWWLATAGRLGAYDRPAVYVKTQAFDPFPFPAATGAQAEMIGAVAERLDVTRRTALDENVALTMTGLYNLVAAIRGGTLDPADEGKAVKARARIVAKLHDDLDAAVAAAYGWPADLSPADIVARLVALNAARAAEEAAGHVRWLRPEYQIGRIGGGAATGGAASED